MTSDDLSLMVKYNVQFEHFDRLEVVDLKKIFFLLSLLLILPPSFSSFSLYCSAGNLKCLSSGFEGVLELVMLLKQCVHSPFKVGSINFAQVRVFWLDIFDDTV